MTEITTNLSEEFFFDKKNRRQTKGKKRREREKRGREREREREQKSLRFIPEVRKLAITKAGKRSMDVKLI